MGFNNDKNRNGNNTAREELVSARHRLAKADYDFRKQCTHRNGKFPALKPITESNRNIEIKPYYRNADGSVKESIVVCDICGAVFDSNVVSPDKLAEALFVQSSMLEQIKMMFKLDESEFEELVNDAYSSIDNMNGYDNFYNVGVKDMKDNRSKNNNGGGNRSTKGNIGLQRSMFNTRNY